MYMLCNLTHRVLTICFYYVHFPLHHTTTLKSFTLFFQTFIKVNEYLTIFTNLPYVLHVTLFPWEQLLPIHFFSKICISVTYEFTDEKYNL